MEQDPAHSRRPGGVGFVEGRVDRGGQFDVQERSGLPVFPVRERPEVIDRIARRLGDHRMDVVGSGFATGIGEGQGNRTGTVQVGGEGVAREPERGSQFVLRRVDDRHQAVEERGFSAADGKGGIAPGQSQLHGSQIEGSPAGGAIGGKQDLHVRVQIPTPVRGARIPIVVRGIERVQPERLVRKGDRSAVVVLRPEQAARQAEQQGETENGGDPRRGSRTHSLSSGGAAHGDVGLGSLARM